MATIIRANCANGTILLCKNVRTVSNDYGKEEAILSEIRYIPLESRAILGATTKMFIAPEAPADTHEGNLVAVSTSPTRTATPWR